MCACIAGASLAVSAPALAVPLETVALPAASRFEVEPNNVFADATPIASGERIRGSLAVDDVDCYGFTAAAGDRLFANTVTAGSSGGFDTELRLLDANGNPLVPPIEDDDDGSQFEKASSIAGAIILASGSYCLEVRNGGTAAISQYDLYFQLRSGSPVAETDATNGTSSTTDSLAGGWVSGTHETAADEDWFSLPLQAGDTVFLSLGITGDASKAQMGLVLPQELSNPLFALGSEETPDVAAPSEALTMTVSSSDTYFVKVASRGGSLTENWSYELSATVISSTQPSCRAYPSAEGEFKDGKTMIFPIPVTDAVDVARAAVELKLTQSVMADLDVSLRTPSAAELPLFSNLRSNPPGVPTQMESIFDDFAAVPSLYRVMRPLDLQTSGGGRLALLANQPTPGTWSLVIKDDQLNESVGSLKSARLILCGPDSLLPPGTGGNSGGKGSPPPQSNPPPKSPPTLSAFAVAPSKFRAAKSGPMVLAKRPKAGGGLVTYQSSEAAQTNLVLFDLEEGRKVGKKCVKPTALNSTKKPCVRPVKVISFVRNDAAGRNQFGFTGRVGARKLPPGEYQLQARAYAPSGLTSAPVSATFTVLPPAAKAANPRRR